MACPILGDVMLSLLDQSRTAMKCVLALLLSPLCISAQVVSPEPSYAVALFLGGGMGDGMASVRLAMGLEWGGERGLQFWKIVPPLGVKPETVIPAALGQISGEADGGIWRMLSLLHVGHGYEAYEFFDGSKVPVLLDILIDQARDRKPIEDAESASFLYTLSQAGRTRMEAFEKHAGPIPTRSDLMNRPAQWRGKVVKLHGHLRRLRALPADIELQKFGIGPSYYEGWIFQDQYGAHPVCVLVTSLPEGLVPAENLNVEVDFAGFFYKVYGYASAQTKQGDRVMREAPLLIGSGLRLRATSAPPPVDGGAWTRDLLPIFIAVIMGTIGVGMLMNWWSNRSDKVTRARLRSVQDRSRSKLDVKDVWPAGNQFPFGGENGTGHGSGSSKQ